MREQSGSHDGSGAPDLPDSGQGETAAHLEYASYAARVAETYLYWPAPGFFTTIVTAVKHLQLRRLDARLLDMLIALIAVIAVVTALA